MKRIFLILLAALLLFSCSDDDDDPVVDSTLAEAGTAPVINKVDLIVNGSNGYFQVDSFYIGENANFAVEVTDPDRDISELELSQFYPSDATTPVYGPDIVPLGTPPGETVSVSLLQDQNIIGPKGSWRGEFIIRDKAGNASDPFIIYVLVE